jgi:Tetratricopeptide repeat
VRRTCVIWAAMTVLLALPARAEPQQCIGTEASRAIDACGAIGQKRTVTGARRVPFHSAPPPRSARHQPSGTHAPGKLPEPERDPLKLLLKARAMSLLIGETTGLERLLANTSRKSPDRLQLLRRVAEDWVELETAASSRHDRLALRAERDRENKPKAARAALLEAKRAHRIEVAARKSSIARYTQLKNQYPNYPKLDEVLYYLAFEYERAQDTANARKIYYELIQKAPKSPFIPNAYLAFGELFFQEAQGDPAKWDLAAQAYGQALRYPPPGNKVYGIARYKLGFVRWNQDELPEALSEFKRVVEYGTQWPKQPNATALAKAARNELVSVYSASGSAARAYAFFQPLSGDASGESGKTLALADRLGLAYLDLGRYGEAITLYRDLLGRDPGVRECHYQTQITTAVEADKSGDKPSIVRELDRQLALREAFSKKDVPDQEKLRCSNGTAALLAETAMAWHLEAVGSGGVRGTNDEHTMDYAATLYQKVTDHFARSEWAHFEFPRIVREDWPTLGKIRYALADLHYARGRWDECAKAFDAVVAGDPKGPDAAEAAYAALICYQKIYERSHDEKTARRGRGLGPGSEGHSDWQKLAPKPLGEVEQRMLGAFGRYLCFIEPKKGDKKAQDQQVEVEFARSRLYYEAQHWEEAALAFRHIALEHAAHDAGVYAAQLELECLNVLATRAEPKKPACIETMATDVPRFQKLYCAGRSDVDPDQCRILERVGMDLERLRAQALVARADALSSGSSQSLELYRRAGDLYLGLFRAHCEAALARGEHPQQCEHADEILYDIARAYQAAHLLAKAMLARGMLLDPRFGLQDGELAIKASFELGQNHQAIAVYDKAADYFERYVDATCGKQKKCGPNAERALFDSIVLRLGLGQPEKAIPQARNYERWFGAKHHAEVAQIAYAVAAHYGEKEKWSDVHRRLGASESLIEKTAPLEVKVQAFALHGRALAQLEQSRAAEREYAKVVRLWADPKQAAAEIQALDGDDAAKQRRLGRALEAVGEALYFFAEKKRIVAERVRFPVYKGPGTKAAVLGHIAGPVRAWIDKKRPLLEDATREYRKIADLVPAAPPRWTIDAGARAGEIWGAFVKEFRAAPIPDSIRKDPELRNAYYEALDRASEPQKRLAKSAFETCLDYSSKYQFWDTASRRCEQWLADNYRAEYHVIDEFRAAPSRRNDVLAERSPPLRLRPRARR